MAATTMFVTLTVTLALMRLDISERESNETNLLNVSATFNVAKLHGQLR
jgi:hypothetical protein